MAKPIEVTPENPCAHCGKCDFHHKISKKDNLSLTKGLVLPLFHDQNSHRIKRSPLIKPLYDKSFLVTTPDHLCSISRKGFICIIKRYILNLIPP